MGNEQEYYDRRKGYKPVNTGCGAILFPVGIGGNWDFAVVSHGLLGELAFIPQDFEPFTQGQVV